jgi:hypothetical protein
LVGNWINGDISLQIVGLEVRKDLEVILSAFPHLKDTISLLSLSLELAWENSTLS